jgi:peptidoglycan/LPS O-acetylase OafA/YrhL
MVYVFHYGGGLQSHNPFIHALGVATETGWTGVTLFFALSGFLITGGLWDSFAQPHWLRNFYVRRALRILPLYYLALALCFVVSVASGAQFSELSCIPIHALFLQNIPIDYISSRAFNGWISLPLYHLWSLAVEEQFYVLWPAMLFLAHESAAARPLRRGISFCLNVFAASWLYRILYWGLPHFHAPAPFTDVFLPTHAGALALGAAVALALRDHTLWPRFQRYALPAFLAGLLTYALTVKLSHSFYLTPPPQFVFGLTGISIAAAATIPLALRLTRVTDALTAPLLLYPVILSPLAFLGRISYGFYVFHILLQPLFNALATHLTQADYGTTYQSARFVLAFPITTLVAWLSFRYFEEPIIHLNRRFPLHNPLP